MIHYVYITTNILTGQQYVGDRSCKNISNDSYLGSGTYLKNSIKKYGKEKFIKKVIDTFNTRQEAYEAQEKYINEYNTLYPNGYNLNKRGGSNINEFIGMYNKNHSNLTKEKMKKSHQGKKFTEEHKKHLSEALKNRKLSENHKRKIGESEVGRISPFKGHCHSKESIKLITQATIGKNNPMFGKKHSLKSKEKISKTLKNIKIC